MLKSDAIKYFQQKINLTDFWHIIIYFIIYNIIYLFIYTAALT